MSISVVIATRNSSRTIERCVSSLRDLKSVVVDNYSKDSTLDIVRRFGAEILMERDSGFFGAYDLGFRRTNSDFVMFLDSDAYLQGFDFGAALRPFRNLQVGMVVCLAHAPVTGTVSKLMNDIWYWRNSQTLKYMNGLKMSWLDRQYSKFFMSNSLNSGATTTGPCYILRRAAIEEMGGMHHGADDFALKRLLAAHGYEVRFYVSDSVFHFARPTLGRLLREYLQFGLRGSQIAKRFYSKKERLVGLLMVSMSIASAPYIAQNKRDPRLLLLVPLIRCIQGIGLVLGSLLSKTTEERWNFSAY